MLLWMGGKARQLLAHIILLICTGLILKFDGLVQCAPAIGAGAGISNQFGKDGPIVENDSIDSLNEAVPQLNNITELGNNSASIPEVEQGSPPNIIVPESFVDALQVNGTYRRVELVYEPEMVIRCSAEGNPKPNVTWKYEDGTFSDYVRSSCMSYDTSVDLHSDKNMSWTDLKLPMMNNAFYGKVICIAENQFGNDTLEILLTHNANSSIWMKTVRCLLSGGFLLVCILFVRFLKWLEKRREDKRYEKLAPQDLEVIHKFKKGLVPPPPSPSSSIVVEVSSGKCILTGTANCVKTLNETVSAQLSKCEGTVNPTKEGYRSVKRESSSPDFQHRLLTGGASTPSICSSNLVLDAVNSWTNYCPYNDKMELSSQHFSVDYTRMLEKGSYGIVFAGKIRNDLTMEWSAVGVKCGKTQRNEDNFSLESMLTELKILASLPKHHDCIVNLKGAYTKTLHKRQAFLFVDYCENGNLASFIDLNRDNFNKTLDNQSSETQTSKSQSSIGDTKIVFEGKVGVKIDCDTDETVLSFMHLLLWAKQVAEGMHFLHKNRILHGNLSTNNVYLTGGLHAKIGNIGYSSPEEVVGCMNGVAKKWLSVPHYCYEQFSKRSDIWDYGRVLWEIFSLRKQICPDNGVIVDYMQYYNDEDEVFESEEIGVPEYATEDIYELMMYCWNENATLCPEFDVYAKSFKKIIKVYQA